MTEPVPIPELLKAVKFDSAAAPRRPAPPAEVVPARALEPEPEIAALLDPSLPPDVLVLHRLAVQEVEVAAYMHESQLLLARRLHLLGDSAPAMFPVARVLRELITTHALLSRRVEGLFRSASALKVLRGFQPGPGGSGR